jgi:hypothetical protein
MTVHVTQHAIERYQERVANLPEDQVRQILSSPFINTAADFGAIYVKLATRHRVVIEDGFIVTVLSKERGSAKRARHIMRREMEDE